jgi:hypothetical protein
VEVLRGRKRVECYNYDVYWEFFLFFGEGSRDFGGCYGVVERKG